MHDLETGYCGSRHDLKCESGVFIDVHACECFLNTYFSCAGGERGVRDGRRGGSKI